jgi:hypothetical protein
MLMRRLSIAAALAVAALVVSTAAHAEDAGLDEVTLKNGGTIRGTVVAQEPGTSVKILEMGSTETRTIPWSQVSDVERNKYAPRTAAVPQPGPAGPGYVAPSAPVALQPIPLPEPTLGAVGVVKLHVESSEPVQIFEHGATQMAGYGGYALVIDNATLICTSPCDRVIDGRRGQRFTAQGDFPGVKSFQLNTLKDSVDLAVSPGSNARKTGGLWATVLGAVGLASGGTLLALSGSLDSINGGSGGGGKTAGIGILVGSGVALVGGIVLLATSGTSWDLHPTAAAPAKHAKARLWLGEF